MGRKKRRVSLLSGISPMSLASVMTSAAGDAALTYEGAYINRSGETNGSNKTISLGFSGEVPTGSDYKTGITIEVTGDNGSNYETLDLDATTQAIVNTNYIQYTLTGTVDTFQGLSGTEGHQVKISYDGSQTWYDGTITDDTTLNNASTINLLEDIVEVWHLSDADAAIASANDLTNNNVVTFVPAKLGVGAQMSRTGPKYLSHADSSVFNPSADFTWSFWIKFDTVGIWQYIISKFDWSGATNADYLIYTQDTSVMNFLKKASGVSKRVTWGTALNATDTWYHIVAYNEDNVEIGLSVDAGTHVVLATETGMDDNALPIAFGSSSDGAAASAVAGIMDEIALHSKALSADEVTDLYNGTDGKAYPYIPNFMAPSFVSGFLTFVEMNRGVEESDTTVPEDTENITAWRDQYSGNDIDFVQDTSSNQPVYDTDHFGLAGVVFDGTDDFISHTTSSVANFERTDDFYLIVAFKTPASFGTGFQALFSHQINSGTYAGWLLHHVDKTTRMQMRYNASNDVNVAGGTALSNDTFYIVEVKYTGAAIPTASNIQIYLNGVAETLTDNSVGTVNGTTQSIGEAMIGARGIDGVSTTGYSACIIAAAGCYAQLPTDAERIKLRSYLLNKYGGQ